MQSVWGRNVRFIFCYLKCEELLAGQEQVQLEEDRSRILARVDDLKHRVSELEQQLQETKQEVRQHVYN